MFQEEHTVGWLQLHVPEQNTGKIVLCFCFDWNLASMQHLLFSNLAGWANAFLSADKKKLESYVRCCVLDVQLTSELINELVMEIMTKW